MVGVPLGPSLLTGATLCCDPISWFSRGTRLLSNPSVFVLGLPGLGKSSLIRRMALGLTGYGVMPLVLGDLKPDYVDLIEALGGQVIVLGRGRGCLNVLDPGEAIEAAARLTGSARQEVLADHHGRRLNTTAGLITISRGAPLSDRENTLLDVAMRILDDHHGGVPVLSDVLDVLEQGPAELRDVALDRGDLGRYRELTDGLAASLISITRGGRLGGIFSAPTTTPMRRDRPVVFDVSNIDDGDTDLQAAVLLACWSTGFASVNISNVLADAGLEPRRHYFVILDELWRALRAGRGIVDRVDALTRLNRQRGVGVAMISHTMADLMGVPEEDRPKARGFVERSGMVICGGLPEGEMPLLNTAIRLSGAEQQMLTSWSTPPSWDSRTGQEADPPGRGKFLIKVGTKPGIPVKVTLTHAEGSLHDTNRLWHSHSGPAAPSPATHEPPTLAPGEPDKGPVAASAPAKAAGEGPRRSGRRTTTRRDSPPAVPSQSSEPTRPERRPSPDRTGVEEPATGGTK
jgi:hypothetical protein